MTIASTTAADPGLTRLVALIVGELQPLQVWLFGSRAEGRARPDSDYDLLVVLPNDAPKEFFDAVRAWSLGDRAGVIADIVPCTRREFDDEKDLVDTLPRAAWLRGMRLYDR